MKKVALNNTKQCQHRPYMSINQQQIAQTNVTCEPKKADVSHRIILNRLSVLYQISLIPE